MLLVSDVSGLADLYAVGVVGAIACNLGATGTDKTIPLKSNERAMMIFTFLLMSLIEISLFIDKPNARIFAAVILVVGLIMRELAKERAARKKSCATTRWRRSRGSSATSVIAGPGGDALEHGHRSRRCRPDTDGEPMLCAVRGLGRTLDFALREAQQTRRPLYLLFVREQTIITVRGPAAQVGQRRRGGRDLYLREGTGDGKATVLPCYAVSDSAAGTIVDVAATVGASRLLLGAPNRNSVLNLLRGNIVREVSALLPEEIDLLVYA